ncbi:hypothetical protein E1B28_010385 [Marasmius oreades]|uniref:Uncharacterized protein n=1 Tax=Marasmius oreades TaxID=181124 RepID=A0A9P7RXP5_9AGAR|nr:uncharacterized protein E1B28_010385 [Marasmius oreades]KAG7091342.1 hypothetical protein E1B28_010385 [Marasmius oreades]
MAPELELRPVRSTGDSSPSSSSLSSQSDSIPSHLQIDSPDYSPSVIRNSVFISSPLNPSSPDHRPCFNSLGRKSIVTRFPSEDARALGNSSSSPRNSMILYHLVDDGSLPSPPRIHSKRESINSLSGDTVVSVSSDSKYPSGNLGASERGLIAYAYDPALDDDVDDDDWENKPLDSNRESLSKRGILNVGGLLTLFLIAVGLLLILPIVDQKNYSSKWLITHNPRINSTGQAEEEIDVIPNKRRNETPALDIHIDPSTPVHARKIMVPRAKTEETVMYDLVFSREGDSLCGSIALHDLNPSPSHLVEFRYRDGFRSFWHNGIWQHVRNDEVDIPTFVITPSRLWLARRYVEFEADRLCQGGLHIEYLRMYRIS